MSNRRKSRELAFKILFQSDFQKKTIGSDIQTYILNSPQFHGYNRDHLAFATELVKGVQTHSSDLEDQIAKNSLNWRMDRMHSVDLTIMKLATYEILHQPDIPKKVSLNEALELSKIFGSKDSSSFINGVIDKIQKKDS